MTVVSDSYATPKDQSLLSNDRKPEALPDENDEAWLNVPFEQHAHHRREAGEDADDQCQAE